MEFLWLQYSRLSTPDIPMVLLVLLAILSLIKTESYPKYRYFWSFIAGLSLGLGFLVRSFMIFANHRFIPLFNLGTSPSSSSY